MEEVKAYLYHNRYGPLEKETLIKKEKEVHSLEQCHLAGNSGQAY